MRAQQGIHILIVDDDVRGGRALCERLINDGHQIELVCSGAEGLQQAYRSVPDLIILDVMMPDMDGFEVCERLRAAPETAEVPVMMLTALDDRKSRLRGIEVGADEFLSKPVDLLEMRLRVNGISRVNRYRRLLDERQRALAALTQARDAALEASRLKTEFLATISHELRTPMAGIIGMTELLLTTPLDGDQTEFAHTVLDSSHSLMAMIAELLDYTKLEAGQLLLRERPFALAEALQQPIDALSERAGSKGLALSAKVAHDVPPTLYGDSQRFQQVLLKLLDNAIKFTKQGQVVVYVDMIQMDDGAHVRIAVHDSGTGVGDTARNRLFQPFSLVDGSKTRQHGGVGLSLALYKQLVQLMGGTIALQSDTSQGATFCFCLPLSHTQAPSSGNHEPATHPAR